MRGTMSEPEDDRRHHPRRPVSVPTRIFAEQRLLLTARTLDVSMSGALLHGTARVELGQTVRVEVSRGGNRNPLVLAAEVVRIETPMPGLRRHVVALRWLDPDAADTAAIASLIRSDEA
jgi:PilZ domain-containing protein